MENLNKNKKIYLIICGGVIVICVIVCWFFDSKNNINNYNYLEIENINEKEIQEITIDKDNTIIVHITGEVKNPGVVQVKEGSRIKDVIEAAGGMTEFANVNKVNLAYEVSDGQKIYIPNISDVLNEKQEIISVTSGENVIVDGTESNNNSKVNINTATQTELETLTGIGPSIASKIIEYRMDNGKFNSIEEIKNVSGVGEAKYKNIEDEICVK